MFIRVMGPSGTGKSSVGVILDHIHLQDVDRRIRRPSSSTLRRDGGALLLGTAWNHVLGKSALFAATTFTKVAIALSSSIPLGLMIAKGKIMRPSKISPLGWRKRTSTFHVKSATLLLILVWLPSLDTSGAFCCRASSSSTTSPKLGCAELPGGICACSKRYAARVLSAMSS
jgi:hypothetical protein